MFVTKIFNFTTGYRILPLSQTLSLVSFLLNILLPLFSFIEKLSVILRFCVFALIC